MEMVTFCQDAYEVAEDADGLVVVTEWNEFLSLDMTRIRQAMRHPVIIDGRNIYDPVEMERHGFIYRGIGRAATPRFVMFSPGESAETMRADSSESLYESASSPS